MKTIHVLQCTTADYKNWVVFSPSVEKKKDYKVTVALTTLLKQEEQEVGNRKVREV